MRTLLVLVVTFTLTACSTKAPNPVATPNPTPTPSVEKQFITKLQSKLAEDGDLELKVTEDQNGTHGLVQWNCAKAENKRRTGCSK